MRFYLIIRVQTPILKNRTRGSNNVNTVDLEPLIKNSHVTPGYARTWGAVGAIANFGDTRNFPWGNLNISEIGQYWLSKFFFLHYFTQNHALQHLPKLTSANHQSWLFFLFFLLWNDDFLQKSLTKLLTLKLKLCMNIVKKQTEYKKLRKQM